MRSRSVEERQSQGPNRPELGRVILELGTLLRGSVSGVGKYSVGRCCCCVSLCKCEERWIGEVVMSWGKCKMI